MGSQQGHGLAAANFQPSALMAHNESPSRGVVSIRDTMPTYVKELIAGGVAGGFAKTVVAPLERVKILYQTRYGNFQSLGIIRSLNCILKNEGVRGFYKGNGASVMRVVPYAALHFMTYEQYRRWIIEHYPLASPGAAVDLFAGSMAGGTAVLCTYPLDLARTKLAYQVWPRGKLGSSFQAASPSVAYRGILDVFYRVHRESGLRGLYRGIGPTMYGMLPYAGLKFYLYEKLKSSLPNEQQNSVTAKLSCGAIAGLIGQTVTYPLDVVRRQMQTQTISSLGLAECHYKSTIDGLVSITRTQGWRQMFAGVSINYVKLVPSVAIGFAAYDGMKSWLRVPPRQNRPATA